MQLTIVIAVIAVAVTYAAYRIYLVITGKKSGCDGCPLAEKCGERQMKHTKSKCCCHDNKD